MSLSKINLTTSLIINLQQKEMKEKQKLHLKDKMVDLNYLNQLMSSSKFHRLDWLIFKEAKKLQQIKNKYRIKY